MLKILPKKTRPMKDLKKPRGGTGGNKIVLTHRNCLIRSSGEKCLDDIDAVFDLNRVIRDSSLAQLILG